MEPSNIMISLDITIINIASTNFIVHSPKKATQRIKRFSSLLPIYLIQPKRYPREDDEALVCACLIHGQTLSTDDLSASRGQRFFLGKSNICVEAGKTSGCKAYETWEDGSNIAQKKGPKETRNQEQTPKLSLNNLVKIKA